MLFVDRADAGHLNDQHRLVHAQSLPRPSVNLVATTAGQGELYAVLGPDAINRATRKAPNGFGFAALAADLDADGRIDIIAGGRATHNVKIYWNRR